MRELHEVFRPIRVVLSSSTSGSDVRVEKERQHAVQLLALPKKLLWYIGRMGCDIWKKWECESCLLGATTQSRIDDRVQQHEPAARRRLEDEAHPTAKQRAESEAAHDEEGEEERKSALEREQRRVR